MKFNYLMPTKIYFGKDVVSEYKDSMKSLGKKALIVTGKKSAKTSGSYDDIVNSLSEIGIEYVLFDEVEENPSLETIEKGSNIGRENNIDFIIGIGGGSPMDAAKAIGVFIKNPEVNTDNIFSQKKLKGMPIVAVPTTSGTGSEVTQYSIVTSNKDQVKRNLGQDIFPELAFIDSKYTENLPYDVTVNTAIDAFTHLVEGYLNSNADFMSDIYGEKGFSLFKDCFDDLINKNLDKDFRDKIMLASTLAGIQIAQNGTSLPHGMGYVLTYEKNLPHGLANGVLTIEYLKLFKDKDRINKFLRIIGLKDLEELEEIFNKLININIDINEEEITKYSQDFILNKEKLRNHTEEVELEDIVGIYKRSLLK